MSYKIIPIQVFQKEAKRLIRKYPSLIKDIESLSDQLKENPFLGTPLGKNCYKIRLAISSKGKGKSGGARIITHVYVSGLTIFLISIYDKSQQADIADSELEIRLQSI